MTKHTPTMKLPLSLGWKNRPGTICDADGSPVFEIPTDYGQQVVLACNSHEELLEALRDAVNFIECGMYHNWKGLGPMKALIAKAEGRS